MRERAGNQHRGNGHRHDRRSDARGQTASSPVLIEGTRVAVTDNQGVYRVVDLRPGTYRVTFTLPGFSRVLREGVLLTATVNVQLAVGALEETVTVNSASPIVDVQSVVKREVVTQETLDTLPIAKSMQSFVAIIPGLQVSAANRDVGGTTGDRPLGTSIDGGREGDQHIYYDGLRSNNFNSAGDWGGGGYSIVLQPGRHRGNQPRDRAADHLRREWRRHHQRSSRRKAATCCRAYLLSMEPTTTSRARTSPMISGAEACALDRSAHQGHLRPQRGSGWDRPQGEGLVLWCVSSLGQRELRRGEQVLQRDTAGVHTESRPEGMPRRLLKFSGGSVDILRDVLH